ncbi:MAG: hypothetical protein CMG25_05315 [Candidatus Marinimicrobia bacterium]|nr:hypothetical protein [Candidatus Neomarinimicrobiota bacterium]|tara:strand:- start:27024 stop:28589 length:1566 start_codon:yes stop_codon:yes gene_type:complete
MNYRLIIYILFSLLVAQDNYLIKNNEINGAHIPTINTQALDETIDSDTYIVGPGDQFYFSMITSNGINNQKLVVSPLGDIIIPIVGKINVDEMILTDVFNTIKSKCKEKIQNSSIDITLSKVKDFKISILGPTGIPSGYYIVNSITRLADIYKFISSRSNDSLMNYLKISSRNIIIESDGNSKKYDLLSYNYNGDEKNNPYIQHGDIIKLSYPNDYFNIYGAVKIPGKYEYREGENLKDFINICGGYQANADSNSIEITRYIDDIQKKIIYLSSDDVSSFKIMPSDEILVKPNKDYKRSNSVRIYGEVKNPGVYTIDVKQNTTIKDVIIRSGGYSSKADTSKIILSNAAIDRIGDQELERILALSPENRSDTDRSYVRARARSKKGGFSSSNFNVENNELSNYKIFDNDVIFIPSRYDFIEIIGAIRNPGRYPYNPSNNIKDYIGVAGGITKNATKKYYIIESSTGDRIPIKLSSQYRFNNQDIIFVEEKNEYQFWDRFKDFIEVTSQILTIIAVIITINT